MNQYINFTNMDIADFVIVRDGENTIFPLIQDLGNLNSRPNYDTIYSENIEPKILKIKELSVSVISNLGKLPFPDFSPFDISNYSPKNKNYDILPILFSRGCINQCSLIVLKISITTALDKEVLKV